MVQEKQSADLDLTAPNERERIRVTYRIGGTEKVEGKELRRLQIFRGEAIETIDLILVTDGGIICPARVDGKGGIARLSPPQQLVVTPLQAGTTWNFDGMMGDTKVMQHYETREAEDVDVPAGKFRAWRIHCDQTAPTSATVDRWFVPGTGFVKVETAAKSASGAVLQSSRLELVALPKIEKPPAANSPSLSEKKVSVGLASEPAGNFKTEFKSDTPAIYVRWHAEKLPPEAQIRAVFIAESVADVAADYQIDESSTTVPAPKASGTFTLSKPEDGWAPGSYRVELYVDDALWGTTKLEISK